MRAELASLNHCAVPFLSWCNSTKDVANNKKRNVRIHKYGYMLKIWLIKSKINDTFVYCFLFSCKLFIY